MQCEVKPSGNANEGAGSSTFLFIRAQSTTNKAKTRERNQAVCVLLSLSNPSLVDRWPRDVVEQGLVPRQTLADNEVEICQKLVAPFGIYQLTAQYYCTYLALQGACKEREGGAVGLMQNDPD
mmetsp:Transcript_18868/g.42712  ORF Transcript_18868/g.42712 Transcript_18868/m.42712 type:complete len:123 (-) Transcript_18868:35-403(-)